MDRLLHLCYDDQAAPNHEKVGWKQEAQNDRVIGTHCESSSYSSKYYLCDLVPNGIIGAALEHLAST